MKTCKQLGLKALRLERQGDQLGAAKAWRDASKVAETEIAHSICEIRRSQAYIASNSELHSAANGDSTCYPLNP